MTYIIITWMQICYAKFLAVSLLQSTAISQLASYKYSTKPKGPHDL